MRIAWPAIALLFTFPLAAQRAEEATVVETDKSRIADTGGELSPTGFVTGEPFPDISFPTGGNARRLSIDQYRGRKVILHVFASW